MIGFTPGRRQSGFVFGVGKQLFLQFADLTFKRRGIEPLILPAQPVFVTLRHVRRIKHPLAGRARRIVKLLDPAAQSLLADEFYSWLKEVGIKPQSVIEPVEQQTFRAGIETLIPHRATDHRVVLLLDITVVILAVRARAGKGDALLSAVAP